MEKDPIVDEVRKNRKKMLDGFGGNIDKLMDYLKDREKSEKGKTFISKPVLRKRAIA